MATRICRRAFIVSLCGVSTWPLVAARAQTYPSRPITMVVPFAAGGGLDVLGRILAARMSEILGHQVIIENATGAAGIVGVKRVVNAAPDGYTFLLGSIGTPIALTSNVIALGLLLIPFTYETKGKPLPV